MKNVFDSEDTHDYDDGIAPVDEKHMDNLVKDLALRLETAKTGDVENEVYRDSRILDLAIKMMGSFTQKLCRREKELLGLISLIVADHDDVVGDFILEMKPEAFTKYCQRSGITLPKLERYEDDQEEGDMEDVDDRNSPLKFFLLAQMFGVDIHCESQMLAFLTICRKTEGTLFSDEKNYPAALSEDSDLFLK
jgi:hypothetical protein